jgi:hypothetical protein
MSPLMSSRRKRDDLRGGAIQLNHAAEWQSWEASSICLNDVGPVTAEPRAEPQVRAENQQHPGQTESEIVASTGLDGQLGNRADVAFEPVRDPVSILRTGPRRDA